MPRRRVGQLSWLDGALSRRGAGRRDVLAEIDGLVDWAPFATALKDIHSAAKGEPSYPPLTLFKVLLLQRWYGLSDPAMEAALFDRISFLRFAGFSTDDETPDHSTIWRFRERLGKDGLIERLFAELQRQLGARGVLVKQGTLIDASIVPSAARRPRMDEGETSPTDPDARFGANNERRRFTFGYKMHVAVDAGSAMVRAWRLTSANVQEVTVAASLLPEEAGTIYADRGYDSGPLRRELASRGFGDGLMRRGNKHHALPADEQERNHARSLVRRPVEAVFGTLKRSYGFHRMRYFSAQRNAVSVALACIGFNLRRWRVCATG
jgi:IS5 family transposase